MTPPYVSSAYHLGAEFISEGAVGASVHSKAHGQPWALVGCVKLGAALVGVNTIAACSASTARVLRRHLGITLSLFLKEYVT